MFTGLVRDRGVVESAERRGGGGQLRLRTRLAAELAIGDSLAVNGVCLTVETISGSAVTATAMEETIARSSLGALRRGEQVNLEPALRAGDPMGGHIVQGHVDGVARIAAITTLPVAHELKIQLPAELARYLVAKGSIAVDGVSLTVSRLEAGSFSVSVIPHTWAETVLPLRRIGDLVNLEVDILAKYVERMLAFGRPGGSEMTLERLEQLGY